MSETHHDSGSHLDFEISPWIFVVTTVTEPTPKLLRYPIILCALLSGEKRCNPFAAMLLSKAPLENESEEETELGETNISKLDARRCYSMGLYEYVVGDSSLKLALNCKRHCQEEKIVEGEEGNENLKVNDDDMQGRLIDFGGPRPFRRWGPVPLHLWHMLSAGSDNMEGKKISIRAKGDSYSVSKIWLWSKKGKLVSSSENHMQNPSSVDVELPWISKMQGPTVVTQAQLQATTVGKDPVVFTITVDFCKSAMEFECGCLYPEVEVASSIVDVLSVILNHEEQFRHRLSADDDKLVSLHWAVNKQLWTMPLLVISYPLMLPFPQTSFVLSCRRLISVNLQWNLNVDVSTTRHVVFFGDTSFMD
ncbi:hypothetical protein Tco_0543856 [Tanacetum coccineum]